MENVCKICRTDTADETITLINGEYVHSDCEEMIVELLATSEHNLADLGKQENNFPVGAERVGTARGLRETGQRHRNTPPYSTNISPCCEVIHLHKTWWGCLLLVEGTSRRGAGHPPAPRPRPKPCTHTHLKPAQHSR